MDELDRLVTIVSNMRREMQEPDLDLQDYTDGYIDALEWVLSEIEYLKVENDGIHR